MYRFSFWIEYEELQLSVSQRWQARPVFSSSSTKPKAAA